MKVLVVAAVLVASVVADVSHIVNTERADYVKSNQVYNQQLPIPILRQAMENNGYGNYKFNYETGNGIQVAEESELKNAGTKDETETAHGSYSYIGDDGITYTVNWIADEYGFRASGAHIPDAIQKALQNLPQTVQTQEATPFRNQQFVNRFVQEPAKPQQFTTQFVQVQAPEQAQQLTSRFVQVQEPAKVSAQQISNQFVQAQEPAPQQFTSRFVQVQEPAKVSAQQISNQFVQAQEPAPQQFTSRFVQVQQPAKENQFINRFVAA